MYWFNLKNIRKAALWGGFLLLVTFVFSCRPDNRQSGAKLVYFDLKAFFRADSARLASVNPAVIKTVTHNGVTEAKTVHIGNWSQELNLFIQSDINRPAWKNSYLVSAGDSAIIYSARTPELKTRRIIIKKIGEKVQWILIYNHTKNLLYETNEKLSYFPDSLYRIEKSQHVKLMGRNDYKVQGTLPKR
ncbi:hypothetical protein LX99_02820 [Mucilaginibacter oryzae]|uniref:Uncharacterized protein n=1 Tax=Mucilaginibacter oryzae TaxID=468058 RepID=A0A316HI44_9SPHI|nr:hypothetical protein [Mucilaginibacter oryzae]PWK77935.1 hypothetical protein LX99_02820 [Mucilaginibacter oryzae]